MKTPEDEAFDDLARKQGAWGGGFPAKRAMAADKLQEPAEWLTGCPTCGMDAGCDCDTGTWSPTPEKQGYVPLSDDGRSVFIDGFGEVPLAYPPMQPPRPVQELVAQAEPDDNALRLEFATIPSSADSNMRRHDNGQFIYGVEADYQDWRQKRRGLTPRPAQEPPSAYESLVRDMTTIAAREVPRGIPIAEFAMHALADAERREHPAPPRPAQEPVACARCKDLEEQAYDLLGQLKAANLKWSVAHPQPAQEPAFGWIKQSELAHARLYGGSVNLWLEKHDCDFPLYTTPPKREWVGLTGDELADLWYKESLDWMEFARAHEAKLKEKNT